MKSPKHFIGTVFASIVYCLSLSFFSFSQAELANDRIINLADDFDRLYQATTSLPENERVDRFYVEFFDDYSIFYREDDTDLDTFKQAFRERLKGAIAHFPSLQETYREKETALSAKFEISLTSFLAVFPDLQLDNPIYLVHSLGSFNGQVTERRGQVFLLFGADMMALLHNWEDDTPVFHHELFHVYHGQYLSCGEELWCSIWQEGLATYVSLELNPEANIDELMLNIPEGMIVSVNNQLAEALQEFKTMFNSHDPDVKSPYLNYSNEASELPFRRGYYLGFLIAQEIHKKYSLKEMAQFDRETVKLEVAGALDRLIANPEAIESELDP